MGSFSDFSRIFTSFKVVCFPDFLCRSPNSLIQDLDFIYEYSFVFHDRKLCSRCFDTIISLKWEDISVF